MLRPYSGPNGVPLHHNEVSRIPSSQWKRSRRLTLFALPLLALIGVFSRNPNQYLANGGLRKLALQCVHNIYALTEQMAYDMPKPPTVSVGLEIPSHIAICQEWIRRGAENNDQAIYIQEDSSVCMDWTSPHLRILEIMASSILDRLNGRSRYRHDCYRSRTWDEAVIGTDRTTVQQMLPVARVEPNSNLLTASELKEQCKICLEQYDSTLENSRVKPYAAHHCLVFPETYASQNFVETTEASAFVTGANKIVLESDAYPPNVIPLTSIYKQVRSRLGYVAKIMSNVTDAPPSESDSGVVIYIDVSSVGIDPSIYQAYFPGSVTSISILTSPLCASGYLHTGELCSDYAELVRDHFRTHYPSLTNTGYKGSHGIQWQMVASTAGMFSRMILAKKLICPPRTPNCLFPAMAKMKDVDAGIDTDAVVLEESAYGKAANFFQVLGHGQGRVNVERLPDSSIPAAAPPPATLPELKASNGEPVAPEFEVINQKPNDEGYLSGAEPAAPLTFSQAEALSDSQVMADIAPQNLPTNSENPNIYQPEMEEQIDPSYIAAAVASQQPININYSQENTTKRATDELGLDVDLAMAQPAYTTSRYTSQLAAYEESEARIRYETRKAKAIQMAEVENGEFPPSMEMEVYCPEYTPDGYQVIYNSGGYVRIDKGDEVIVSDGAGTVIFDGANVDESVVYTPRNPSNGQQPYNQIYDPVTQKWVTISGTNITVNNDNGVTQRDPVGVLLVDNVTNPNDWKATLITEGASGALTSVDEQRKFVGSVIATGEHRTESGTVIRHGRGYAIRQDLEPGTKREIYGPFNGFDSSSSHSSSQSGGSGYDGTYAHHPTGGKSSSEEGGHGTSDSRDQGYDVVGPYSYRKLQDSPSSSEEWTYKSHDDNHHKHRRDGQVVSISVPPEEFKFGNPNDLQRICHKYKDKVEKASEERRAQQTSQQQKLSQEMETMLGDQKPARRHLRA